MKYKYHINHHLSYQPQWLTIDKIAAILEKAGIPRRTFDRDKALKANDEADIPGERLLIYASLFDVSIEQLYSYERKIKPLSKREPSPEMQKIMRRLDLKQPDRTTKA